MFFWLLGAYLFLIGFIIYVMICGNNKFHRNGCVGWVYRQIVWHIPNFCNRVSGKIFPCCRSKDGQPTKCMGVNGPCRYFVITFFFAIYVIFIAGYICHCYSYLPLIFPRYYGVARFFSIFVLPWPWVLVLVLHYMDPGEITAENVESYLKAYPYDNLLYKRKICPTLKIPCPARSRYCKYTRKRIAKYDHYCPWVISPIGERTHKYFVLFLIANMVAASTLIFLQLNKFIWKINYLSPRIHWSQTGNKLQNSLIIATILLKSDSVLLGTTIVLVIIVITLFFFVIQQLHYIGRNETQIELEKIEYIKELKEESDDRTPYQHFYNHGFIQNFKEFLFPPKIEKHKPLDYTEEVLLMEERKRKEE